MIARARSVEADGVGAGAAIVGRAGPRGVHGDMRRGDAMRGDRRRGDRRRGDGPREAALSRAHGGVS